MLKTDFLNSVADLFSVTPDEVFYDSFDMMADQAIEMHLGHGDWSLVQVKEQRPLQLIVGSMVHFSRASKSAKTDFPVENQEGRLDKSELYRNNMEIAIALRREYEEAKAMSGGSVHISRIGRHIATDNAIHPYNSIDPVKPANLLSVTSDDEFVYLHWEFPKQWGFRRHLIYMHTEDPVDLFSSGLVKHGVIGATMVIWDSEITRAKFKHKKEDGVFYVAMVSENINGMKTSSNTLEVEVTM